MELGVDGNIIKGTKIKVKGQLLQRVLNLHEFHLTKFLSLANHLNLKFQVVSSTMLSSFSEGGGGFFSLQALLSTQSLNATPRTKDKPNCFLETKAKWTIYLPISKWFPLPCPPGNPQISLLGIIWQLRPEVWHIVVQYYTNNLLPI